MVGNMDAFGRLHASKFIVLVSIDLSSFASLLDMSMVETLNVSITVHLY